MSFRPANLYCAISAGVRDKGFVDASGRSLPDRNFSSSEDGEWLRLRPRGGGGTEENWRREVGAAELGARGRANIGMLLRCVLFWAEVGAGWRFGNFAEAGSQPCGFNDVIKFQPFNRHF